MESTGLWNVVTGILSKADDGGSITVKIKDVKEAYQQQQQLNNKLMQLNSIISDYNNLLAEKEEAINHLKGYRIMQNGGRGKLWRIWRNEHNSPIFYQPNYKSNELAIG